MPRQGRRGSFGKFPAASVAASAASTGSSAAPPDRTSSDFSSLGNNSVGSTHRSSGASAGGGTAGGGAGGAGGSAVAGGAGTSATAGGGPRGRAKGTNKAAKVLGMDGGAGISGKVWRDEPSSSLATSSSPMTWKASKIMGIEAPGNYSAGGTHSSAPKRPSLKSKDLVASDGHAAGVGVGNLKSSLADGGEGGGGGGGSETMSEFAEGGDALAPLQAPPSSAPEPAGGGGGMGGGGRRRVSFARPGKAAKLLGIDAAASEGGGSAASGGGNSVGSSGAGATGGRARRKKYSMGGQGSFGSDGPPIRSSIDENDEASVDTFQSGLEGAGLNIHPSSTKNKAFRKQRKMASRFIRSVTLTGSAGPKGSTTGPPHRAESAPATVQFEPLPPKTPPQTTAVQRGKARTRSMLPGGGLHQRNRTNNLHKSVGSSDAYDLGFGDEEGGGGGGEGPAPSRKSVIRRDNVDAKTLTMGLDLESANFLDWMTQAKCQEWLKSLKFRDPRANIKEFFDDVARDGADRIEEPDGFKPELLSPLLNMFQRSSVFSVWRPTSIDSIRKMMTGQGTGKGLDIKGKSAKKGKLSAYVPFLQIHEDEHKFKIRALPRDGRIRIFYKKREARDNARSILEEVVSDMTERASTCLDDLLAKIRRREDAEGTGSESVLLAQDESDPVTKVLSAFRTLDLKKGVVSDDDREEIKVVSDWSMDDPAVRAIDDYSPKCFGLDLPKRLFWEGYVVRARDIGRPPGSVYDTGRPSRASFQDMNFGSIKNEADPDTPRAVVWQYTDPYLPPTEPDPDPMMPQTLLMAYEEHGRVMPVVSDFDCFLLGTRGVRFHSPLPDDQVELVHNMLADTEKILTDCREGKSNNWTASWLETMKHQRKHVHMPKYGFGDPKSYAIMKHAVKRLEEFGAVRHGAGAYFRRCCLFVFFVRPRLEVSGGSPRVGFGSFPRWGRSVRSLAGG
ncbi:hypothetical protein ACHAWF_004810, partial [Thalassiosira exigua]